MGFMDTLQKESSYSTASGNSYQYVVLQVTLKEKFIGTGSGNLTELENVINQQAAKGYRLHTITTANGGSKGLMGGDRIQATMVFEKVIYERKRPPGVPVGEKGDKRGGNGKQLSIFDISFCGRRCFHQCRCEGRKYLADAEGHGKAVWCATCCNQ